MAEMKLTISVPDNVQESVKKSLEGFGTVEEGDIQEEITIILEEVVFKNWDKINFGNLHL